MYRFFLKPLLFLLEPEAAHVFLMKIVAAVNKIPGMRFLLRVAYAFKDKRLETTVFGIRFPNPVGLAAGFDKSGDYFNDLEFMGFGFIEVGTVTPMPQVGNPKPRIFRLKRDKAIINRLGFNNNGAAQISHALRKKNPGMIIGGNIGKNKSTLNEDAQKDYVYCFEQLFDAVDYFVVNVSSPNTLGLRELQDKEPLQKLLSHLQGLNQQKVNPKPILLKIAPDLTDPQLDDIIEVIKNTRIAGVVATNTTWGRENLTSDAEIKKEFGGLSGQPLRQRSTDVIKYLADRSGKQFEIVGVGGILTAEDAIEKLNAGASLVQLYTGLVYEGPSLVKKINKKILSTLH